MDFASILDLSLEMIGEGRPALLSTLGPDGFPRSRWMMPAALPRLRGRVYAVTARNFAKASQIQERPLVEWTLQSPGFREVVSLRGRARIVVDPAFSAEVLKAVGPNLSVFWSVNPDPASVVVIETEIESAALLDASRGTRHTAFPPEAEGGRDG